VGAAYATLFRQMLPLLHHFRDPIETPIAF
jgi:hypothetical protein